MSLRERVVETYESWRALHHDVELLNDPQALELLVLGSIAALHLSERVDELLEDKAEA